MRMKMKRTKSIRNGELDILRFLFAIDVVMSHLQLDVSYKTHFTYDAVGVEFFFLCSGYFLAKHGMEKKNDDFGVIKDSWSFILKKAWGIWRYYILAIVINSACIFADHGSFSRLLTDWLESLPLIFFLNQPLHQTPVLYLRGCWYLSAMMVAAFVLYFLLQVFREKFVHIIAPCMSLFLIGYLITICEYKNRFTLVHDNGYFMNGGILRAIAVMGCGVFIYGVARELNARELSKKAYIALAACKYLLFGIVALQCFNKLPSYYTQVFLLLCVAFVLLNVDRVPRIGAGRFTDYLGKLSLTYYLMHGIVLYECVKHLPLKGIRATAVILFLIFVLANILLYLSDFIFGIQKKKMGNQV